MVKKLAYLILFIALFFIWGCSSFHSEQSNQSTFENIEKNNLQINSISPSSLNNRYIVIFEDKVTRQERAAIVSKHGSKALKNMNSLPALVILLPEQASPRALEAIANNSGVIDVIPDLEISATRGKPSKPPKNDPPPPAQELPWGVDRIDAELAWVSNIKGNGINVAVIDTGIDKDHPDLGPISGGINYVIQKGRINPSAWDDDNGHGTHVAGIIAARDNEIGVIGVAPLANLYAVKVLNKRGIGNLSDLIDAINWCRATKQDQNTNNDINVINMSLSFNEAYDESDFPYLSAAIKAASQSGIVLVGAAGNNSTNVAYPASDDEVIAVSAINSNDQFAGFSNYGPQVEFTAPGVQVKSTYKGGGYEELDGTSMAAPHVSGTVALMLSSTYSDQLYAENLGLSPYQQGNGLIDAEISALATTEY